MAELLPKRSESFNQYFYQQAGTFYYLLKEYLKQR